MVRFGPQVCGDFAQATSREWLVVDGTGGYAMGTVAGLRTRRYHGLLVVAARPPGGRMLGLAAVDLAVLIGDRRVELATHEWADGTVAPQGYRHLSSFAVHLGVPRWRWQLGPVVLEAELAMAQGRAAVGIVHRLLAAPAPLQVQLTPLVTWRDVHGERYAQGEPHWQRTADGFVFEDALRVAGPGFEPDGQWWYASRQREEAARGLGATEDLFRAGRFVATLAPGDAVEVGAWAAPFVEPPAPATALVAQARARAAQLARQAGQANPALDDETGARLAHAADQFIVHRSAAGTSSGPGAPTVVAGYPWFGEWSRDTMTAYEGLFLCTGRSEEGRRLLEAAAATLSGGMLANTTDSGVAQYNTADATLWFLHAVAAHTEHTGDAGLVAALAPHLVDIVDQHLAGTRFGIRVDPADGLVTQGAPGVALTWMDARIGGAPVTPRAGKAVELNALWVSAMTRLARHLATVHHPEADRFERLAGVARASFARRFPIGTDPAAGLYDVVSGPAGDDASLRPNQLLAVSLPDAPLREPGVLEAVAPLVTPLGLRSLSPTSAEYCATHRGGPTERDRAYHQGTVWPWLIGPYIEACLRLGTPASHAAAALEGLSAHLDEWGVGSVSETAEGTEPHAATGCPFQAWSVAELVRARSLVARASTMHSDRTDAPSGAPTPVLRCTAN